MASPILLRARHSAARTGHLAQRRRGGAGRPTDGRTYSSLLPAGDIQARRSHRRQPFLYRMRRRRQVSTGCGQSALPGVDHLALVLRATAGCDTRTPHWVSSSPSVAAATGAAATAAGQQDGHDDGREHDGGDDDPHCGSSGRRGDHVHHLGTLGTRPRRKSCLAR